MWSLKTSIIASILMCIGYTCFAEGFVLESLDEAMKLSQETKKPLLVVFGADYCVWCEKLKSDLKKGLLPETDDYIVCYIDLEKHPKYIKEYKIGNIPDSRIIKAETEAKLIGYNRTEYRKWLKNNE